jgi:hypothetical protein
MRAFVAVRQLITNLPIDRVGELQKEVRELKQYMDEILTDQNDINEETYVQLELINQTLAELQTDKRLTSTTRKRIGFHRDEE